MADNTKEKKLVKATELPVHGNPYPPKDQVQNDTPGMLEVKIRSIRTTLQPYFAPVASAYEKTSDILSIGAAHSQSTIQSLAQNQSSVLNALIISGSTLVGIALARRKGVFKKLLFGSVFFSGAYVVCYPKETEETSKMLLYIARNKLPLLAQQQYEKFTKTKSNDSPKQETTESKPTST